MAYEERYCAYVDVLGFRELIRDLDMASAERQAAMVDEIEALLYGTHSPFEEAADAAPGDLRIQTVSDAICVSAPVNEEDLAKLLGRLGTLTMNLLRYGYFVRGAVVKGRLHHTKQFVFGGALVKAYRLESEVARYPRIMLTREVADAAWAGRNAAEGYPDVLRPADDGPFFVHVLGRPLYHLEAGAADGRQIILAGHLRHIAGQIQRRFNDAVDDPRIFEKVQWFAKYWNASTSRVRHLVPNIRGPGLGPLGIE